MRKYKKNTRIQEKYLLFSINCLARETCITHGHGRGNGRGPWRWSKFSRCNQNFTCTNGDFWCNVNPAASLLLLFVACIRLSSNLHARCHQSRWINKSPPVIRASIRRFDTSRLRNWIIIVIKTISARPARPSTHVVRHQLHTESSRVCHSFVCYCSRSLFKLHVVSYACRGGI